MTDEQQKFLNAIKLLLDPDLKDYILLSEDSKQSAPIRISFRSKLLPEETEPFSTTFRRVADDFLKPETSLTDRLLADLGSNKKKKSKTGKTSSIVYILSNSISYIDSDFSDCVEFAKIPVRDLTDEQAARLFEEIYFTWKSLGGNLRTPRRCTDKMVRGYFKQRENYSHAEIVEGLKTYGLWADAKQRAIKAGDLDSFWFHSWKLEAFLISNKSMSHVDGGWEDLKREKNIPEQFSKSSEDWLSEFDRKNQLSRERNERIRAEQKAAINE